jgi:hypothetical protein
MPLEPVQVVDGDILGEVVRRRLDGVEPHVRGQVHVLEQIHPGRLRGQVVAIGIRGDAQLEMAGPGPADGGDGPSEGLAGERAKSGRRQHAPFQDVTPG